MNKILTFIFAILFAIPCFADIGATNGVANSATCDSGALDTDSGGAALEAQYSPETINLKWYDEGGTRIATNSCTYDNGITLPSNPTRTGYTFKGWRAIPGTRIEYLQSDGNQYIDTGWSASTDKVSIEVQFDPIFTGYGTLSKHFTVFGSQKADYSHWIYMYGGNNSEITNISIYLGTTTGPSFVPQTGIHYVKYIINNGTITQIYDDTSSSSSYYGTIVSGANLYLFAGSLGNAVEPYDRYKGKIYMFKIYENNILVRDMIPVKDSNGVPCMYDKVSGQFFYNQGTGNFVAGPEI